jgi:hypothetical protein
MDPSGCGEDIARHVLLRSRCPVFEHHDAACHAPDDRQIMGDEDDAGSTLRSAHLNRVRREPAPHTDASSAEVISSQISTLRFGCEGAGNGDALLLAARELSWIAVEIVRTKPKIGQQGAALSGRRSAESEELAKRPHDAVATV